jgi:membrane fusion protein (multidrug efflux system)
MAADVNLGSPTRHPGSDSDEIQNFDNPSPEAEPAVTRQEYPGPDKAPGYRTGYRDGFHDATEAEEHQDDKDNDKDKPEGPPKSRPRRALPYIIGGLVLLALIVGGVLYWLNARHYETTDDAFIDAHVANVSSQISGRVTNILFDDNQQVAAGQLLMEIDPRDYQEKLAQAEASLGSARAQLAQAQAQVALQKANLDQANAQVLVAQADSQQANQDLARYRGVDPRAVTRQDIDKTQATAKGNQARLEAAKAAVGGGRAQIEAAEAQANAAAASVREAEANADNAKLQLSYAKIVAPVAGRVAKRNVELGTYVAPGQALIAVVPTQMYITANFKETQLTDMKPGDPVDIHIDTYPGRTFRGRVDSFQTGTGSAFSVLPAENATGNYVKVVQRVPVKILLDKVPKDCTLGPGMSVEPSVKVR